MLKNVQLFWATLYMANDFTFHAVVVEIVFS